MYHYPDKDVSIDLTDPTFVRARPVRHLLEQPDAETAIDGRYRKAPGDVVDWPVGSHLDPGSQICRDCERVAAEAS